MSSLIRSLGYTACVFCSAEAFLISPRLHDASCLIADVQMAGMSGLELQDELAVRRPDMPVILITAFPEERFRKRAEAAGAVAFFSKPVDGPCHHSSPRVRATVWVRTVVRASQRVRASRYPCHSE